MHVEKMETDGCVAGWVEEQTNTWPRCQHLTLLPFLVEAFLFKLLHMLHLHVGACDT